MTIYQVASVVCGGTIVKARVPRAIHERVTDLASTFDAGGEAVPTPIELYARFMEHCVALDKTAAVAVLGAMCHEHSIPATNIHVVIQQHGLDESAAQLVLRAYYSLWGVDEARPCYDAPGDRALPALFASRETRLTAMFGGQPGSGAYLDEARWLLDVYRPLLGDYVSRMSAFLVAQTQDKRLKRIYREGLDVCAWLTDPATAPNAEYLLSAPVSMPLAGLVQLMHVVVLYKTLGVTPGEVVRQFK
ncbi:hypothetical protein H4R21_004416, partial [Coemansia helicoidea]